MNDDAVVIALGGNLAGEFESSKALLAAALEGFASVSLRVVQCSSWWRSASWPDPALPDYFNGVALVETTLAPQEALAALHALEARFGRVRGKANAPRTLDLDLIAYGRRIISEGAVILPHPRAADRLFVMGPLAEIAPDWMHPTLGETATTLAAKAGVGADARPT